MPDPNKNDPKKQRESRPMGNQNDPSQTRDKDSDQEQSEYSEGGGFGKQQEDRDRDVGQSVQGKTDEERTRKEAVPNQQNPQKKQDKEQPVAGSEKSGAK